MKSMREMIKLVEAITGAPGSDDAENYKARLDAINAKLLPMRKAGKNLAAEAIYSAAYAALLKQFPRGHRDYVKAQNSRMWAGNNWQRDDKSGRSAVDEVAPPGMEDVVMDLKKEYPDDHSRAFATAWSIYNKKHGKAEEGCSMGESVPAVDSCQQTNPATADVACAMEESVSDLIYDQQYSRFSQLMSSFVEPQEAFDVLSREMAEQGIEGEEHDAIMQRLENDFFPDDSAYDMMNGPDDFSDDADALASAGHGSDEDYGGDDFPMEDIQNGYNDINHANGSDFFPNGADGPVVRTTGPSGARHGDNPEQKRMQVAEVHKELVYGYRNFLKESASAGQKS